MGLSTDEDHVPQTEPDAVAIVCRLVRSARTMALATTTRDGTPNVSHSATATLPDGRPLLLLSRLSPHTRHLERDSRAALLATDTVPGPHHDPMTVARVTLTGRIAPVDDRPLARRRFLARNPKAELYADFGDFSFQAMTVEAIHLVGGFARTAKVKPRDVLIPPEEAMALAEMEDGAIQHMNEDHADALALYAQKLAGKAHGDWRATGIDPDGIDLVSDTDVARVSFPERVKDPGTLRTVLKDMAVAARAL